MRNFFAYFLFLLICLLVSGCSFFKSIDSLGFCYAGDDGRQMCGEIGFDQKASEYVGSTVLNRTTNGKTEKVIPLTEAQAKSIREALDEKQSRDVVGNPQEESDESDFQYLLRFTQEE